MGWPFEEASWSVAEGAYHAAVGSEMLWIGLSAAVCIASLIVGAMHENDAYRRADK